MVMIIPAKDYELMTFSKRVADKTAASADIDRSVGLQTAETSRQVLFHITVKGYTFAAFAMPRTFTRTNAS
ncbi:hypothetical protein [Candidatus Methanomassiliicoccus intestinalis]|uniref:hypothetical protein n=1 Tax=Candidatus Methanomassiliicoccus intestinalis TaxID=1406512 RepID=UPI0037DC4356